MSDRPARSVHLMSLASFEDWPADHPWSSPHCVLLVLGAVEASLRALELNR